MYRIHHLSLYVAALLALSACGGSADQESREAAPEAYPSTGSIERLDPALDRLIPAGAQMEVLAGGFNWSEGPQWLPNEEMLIFSDVPENRIYQWKEGDTVASVYLAPSGYTGETSRGGEPGSNGLTLDPEGRLVLCQHGDRRVARMDAPLGAPAPNFTTLVAEYEGKRFNSPNDLVYDARGNLYFTDPPYGLEGGVDSPLKELDFQGVYRLSADGELSLLVDTLTRPNGIALSPDEGTLYVAVSDPQRAWWVAYDLGEDGSVSNGRILYDATPMVPKAKGLPDGMKVRRDGSIWATGPGGVWVFSPEGTHLGTIHTGQATANCGFNAAQDVLYLTADSLLLRLQLNNL